MKPFHVAEVSGVTVFEPAGSSPITILPKESSVAGSAGGPVTAKPYWTI